MSKPKKLNKVGIYMRLSHDDEEGESQSIENQRLILTKYVAEHGGTVIDEYVDDGYSGTNFNRPGFQRLVNDAISGKIDTMVAKDLSRFGRNYAEIGLFVDKYFPSYNLRFIAINDNVDTDERNSAAMEMMPISNLFNEWYASNTSKKVRAVLQAKQKNGENTGWKPPYGYIAGNDEKRTAIIDEEAAKVVRRIYSLRMQGYSYRSIAVELSDEGIPNPSHYYAEKRGLKNPDNGEFWKDTVISFMLKNPFYIGTLIQHKTEHYSFKYQKTVTVSEDERIITENAHEAIIDIDTWNKVQEINKSNSVKRVRADKERKVHIFSGKLVCPDCGRPLKLRTKDKTFICSTYNNYGKKYCTVHSIREDVLEELVKQELAILSEDVTLDEEKARNHFLTEKSEQTAKERKEKEKAYNSSKSRLAELDNLIRSAYEDKVLKKIPEDLSMSLIQGYIQEKETLQESITKLEEELTQVNEDEAMADEYIKCLKKYAKGETLTREMVLQLIDQIEVGEVKTDGSPRSIHIYYKFQNASSNISITKQSANQQIQ